MNRLAARVALLAGIVAFCLTGLLAMLRGSGLVAAVGHAAVALVVVAIVLMVTITISVNVARDGVGPEETDQGPGPGGEQTPKQEA